jgi:hypothetical protein
MQRGANESSRLLEVAVYTMGGRSGSSCYWGEEEGGGGVDLSPS